MSETKAETEVFLRPGEFYFGKGDVRIRTILGSCISITLWHPERKIGGMCHFMLSRPQKMVTPNLDGRYAEDAIELFLQHIAKHKSQAREYQVKVFGGGNMFPDINKHSQTNNIGQRNMQIARELLREYQFRICSSHLGGVGYRRVILYLPSGEVWVYHNSQASPAVGEQF